MQDLQLSWDLFVLAMVGVCFAYGLVVGRAGSVKMMLSAYVALLTTDAFLLLTQEGIEAGALRGSLAELLTPSMLSVLGIGFFACSTVLLTTRGAFDITSPPESSPVLRAVMTWIYAMLCALLVVSALVMLLSGASLFGPGQVGGNAVAAIADQSRVVAFFLQHYGVFFALPALTFALSSLVRSR